MRALFCLVSIGCGSSSLHPDARVADASHPDAAIDARPIDAPPDAQTCVTKPSGLLAWYAGEGNGNDTLATYNAAPTGTVTFANGVVGQAFVFTAGAYERAAFTRTGAFSIDLWAKAATAGQGVFSALLSSANPSHYDPFFQIDFDGSGNYRVQAGNDTLHVAFGAASTTAFQHLAMTYDGAQTIDTYLDGAHVATGTWTGATLQFETLKLGLNRDEQYPYDGELDEVHIWDHALTANDIAAIHAGGVMAQGLCR